MRIEILYPELCNLYGDPFNVRYLMRALKENEISAQLVTTSFGQRPAFVDGSVDLVYLSGMTESAQQLVLAELKNFRSDIADYINEGKFFLATGNAVEIFGLGMESEEIDGFEGLGFFPAHARLDLWKRHNSFFVGDVCIGLNEDSLNTGAGHVSRTADSGIGIGTEKAGGAYYLEVVGFKSQFGHSYWEEGAEIPDPLIRIKRGVTFNGRSIDTSNAVNENMQDRGEGVRIKNFMGTYALGPLLVLNPPLTKALINELGKGAGVLLADADAQAIKLPFESQAVDAYKVRLAEFKEPNRHFQID